VKEYLEEVELDFLFFPFFSLNVLALPSVGVSSGGSRLFPFLFFIGGLDGA